MEYYDLNVKMINKDIKEFLRPNVHRVSTVIKEFAIQAQFLVISHREENIVNADRIYGVAMPQSGITNIFSVDLQEEAKKILELEDIVPKVGEN